MSAETLRVIYILPSRYDDEGFPLRYWRGILPSNTLACLKSLTESVARSGELGGIQVQVEAYDDSVQRLPMRRILRDARRGQRTVVGFVGVQSNQFARAADLAKVFRAADVPVLIGGFHVSGQLAMFPEPSHELRELLDIGVTLVKGEAEVPGVLAGILRDAYDGRLEPIYNITQAPDIHDAPIPQADTHYIRRFVNNRMGTIDTSRGCPFNCSFCTIINVQGRRMRHRSAETILACIDEHYDRGIRSYFFTDDNFSRSPVWEELFDGLAAMRAKGRPVSFMMQVDTQATKIPRFVEKAAAAGCYLVFIGMESVNQDNLAAAGKAQNKVSQFAGMIENWRHAKILTHVGYIIGFPNDSVESVRRDLIFLKDQIKVDEASFFMLTPLPGSRDHKKMVDERVPLDADLNNYDSFHETFRHPNIGPGEWAALYREAFETFYSKENIVNVMLRTPKERYWEMFRMLLWNRYSTLMGTHPMVTGVVRFRDRLERRPVFQREGILRHALRRIRDWRDQIGIFARLFFEFQEVWLITRQKDAPQLRVLADLRERWSDAQQRLCESDLAGRCDVAVQELRGLLTQAEDRLTALGSAGAALSGHARRRVQATAADINQCLHTLDTRMPTWRDVVQAERFIRENVLARYEEATIRYVAQRRRLNAYRTDLIDRLKTGRILTANVSTLLWAAIFEIAVGLRFGYALLAESRA